MAGSNVNITIENWTDDGVTVPVPRWSVNITIQWKGDDGQTYVDSDTYRFPNVLQNVPLSRLRRYMEEIILREARLILSIDDDIE
jgi:hypothetical protein